MASGGRAGPCRAGLALPAGFYTPIAAATCAHDRSASPSSRRR